MDKELEVVEKTDIVNSIKSVSLVEEQVVTPVKSVSNEQPVVPQKDKATEIVEEALSQAIVHRVVSDDNVQKELYDGANSIIKSKVNAIKAQAEKEDKESQFNNKKGVCDCFGCNEAVTPKWAIAVMSAWNHIMTAIWIVIGFFTFAPVTFVAKKITVIFKKTWVAMLLAILIYFIVLATPIAASVLKSKGIL